MEATEAIPTSPSSNRMSTQCMDQYGHAYPTELGLSREEKPKWKSKADVAVDKLSAMCRKKTHENTAATNNDGRASPPKTGRYQRNLLTFNQVIGAIQEPPRRKRKFVHYDDEEESDADVEEWEENDGNLLKNTAITNNQGRASSPTKNRRFQSIFKFHRMSKKDSAITRAAIQGPPRRKRKFEVYDSDEECDDNDVEEEKENDGTLLVYPEPMALDHAKKSKVFVASFGSLIISATSKDTLRKARTEFVRLFVMPASAQLQCMRPGCKFVAPNMIAGLWHMQANCCADPPAIDEILLRETSPAFNVHENLVSILQNTAAPTDGKWDILDVTRTPVSSGITTKHKAPQLVMETKAETNWLKHKKKRDLFDFLVWKQKSEVVRARTDFHKVLPILMAMSFLKAEENWPADFIRKVQERHDE
eukprot:scaffold101680_cov48-Attheya_sp.AAC.2